MLRRNLGKKRVEISEDQSAAILAVYEAFEETKVSKIFDTTDFGYTKVTVERPLRLRYDSARTAAASAVGRRRTQAQGRPRRRTRRGAGQTGRYRLRR